MPARADPPNPRAGDEPLLQNILDQLKRMQKTEMYGEFSLLRMLAGVIQAVVPFCLLMALWLLMISEEGHRETVLVVLGFAGVLQVMALTFYVMQGRK